MSAERHQADLAEMVEMLLDKGVVINADIVVSIGDTELLGIQLRAALASFETAAQYGLQFPEGTDMARVQEAADRRTGAVEEGDVEERDISTPMAPTPNAGGGEGTGDDEDSDDADGAGAGARSPGQRGVSRRPNRDDRDFGDAIDAAGDAVEETAEAVAGNEDEPGDAGGDEDADAPAEANGTDQDEREEREASEENGANEDAAGDTDEE